MTRTVEVGAVRIEQPAAHPDSDDSRTVSRTGIEENTSKEHEQNALPDILVTTSQIPDVNRELAELGAMFAVFRAVKGEPPRS
jgi:hypothetical protein